ncbi:hypothetical protein CerSpe_219580 [Prunus speciosa]
MTWIIKMALLVKRSYRTGKVMCTLATTTSRGRGYKVSVQRGKKGLEMIVVEIFETLKHYGPWNINGTPFKVTNRVRDAVRWAAPPSSRLKFNFDGAFDPTSGKGVVGVVAKDADGGFVAAMAKSVGEVLSAEHAKILVAREGVALALSLGIASPIFEGDSAMVVAAIKRAGHDYSNIGTIIEDVKHLQRQFPGSLFAIYS